MLCGASTQRRTIENGRHYSDRGAGREGRDRRQGGSPRPSTEPKRARPDSNGGPAGSKPEDQAHAAHPSPSRPRPDAICEAPARCEMSSGWVGCGHSWDTVHAPPRPTITAARRAAPSHPSGRAYRPFGVGSVARPSDVRLRSHVLSCSPESRNTAPPRLSPRPRRIRREASHRPFLRLSVGYH